MERVDSKTASKTAGMISEIRGYKKKKKLAKEI
jgi:hypothetical protein